MLRVLVCCCWLGIVAHVQAQTPRPGATFDDIPLGPGTRTPDDFGRPPPLDDRPLFDDRLPVPGPDGLIPLGPGLDRPPPLQQLPTTPVRPISPPGNAGILPGIDRFSDNSGLTTGLGLLASRVGVPGYYFTYAPDRPTTPAGDFGYVRQQLSLISLPLDDGPDRFALGFNISNWLISGNARFSTSNRPLPDTLWDINIAALFAHRFENGWIGGIVVNGGSTSDRPFEQSNVMTAGVIGYMQIPAVEKDAWLVGLTYNPTSEIRYPLPLLSYLWRPDDELSVNIGVPFYLDWAYDKTIRFELFYLPIRTVRSRLTWNVCDGMGPYAGFDWINDTWFLTDRENNGDRLFSYEKRILGGLFWDVGSLLRFEIQAGYNFDRILFNGRQYSDNERDRISVSPGFFGGIHLRLRF
ncbi:MAG: hypothetical protein R3B84_15885 [Zavarzinella sp.]